MTTTQKRIAVIVEGSYALMLDGFGDHAAERITSGTSKVIAPRHTLEPRQEAERRLYVDSKQRLIFPGANLFAALVQAGSFIKVGRKALSTQKSSLVPACVSVVDIEIPIGRPDGKPITWEVDRRSIVNQSTNGRVMCHRPRFDIWQLSFTIEYDSSMIGEATVRELVDYAGQRIGIGVFRPAKKGPFGRFKVTGWVTEK
jgi:hypothetical protein